PTVLRVCPRRSASRPGRSWTRRRRSSSQARRPPWRSGGSRAWRRSIPRWSRSLPPRPASVSVDGAPGRAEYHLIRLLRLVSIVAVACALAGSARAADAPAAATAGDEVERHAALGQRHLEHGRYQDAVAEFRRAYELRAEPRLLLGIAESYRLLGI